MKKQLHNNIYCPTLNIIFFVILKNRILGWMGQQSDLEKYF